MQKMEETLSMKHPTEDISSLEQSINLVSFELTCMKATMNKVSEAITQMSAENQSRDQAENHERDRRVEEKFTNLEKRSTTRSKSMPKSKPTKKGRKENHDLFQSNTKQ